MAHDDSTDGVVLVDEDVALEVLEDTPILEAAEAVGFDLPHQSRMGVCGVCCGRLVDGGEVDQTEGMFRSESEKEAGHVLTCFGTPLSDLRLETDESP